MVSNQNWLYTYRNCHAQLCPWLMVKFQHPVSTCSSDGGLEQRWQHVYAMCHVILSSMEWHANNIQINAIRIAFRTHTLHTCSYGHSYTANQGSWVTGHIEIPTFNDQPIQADVSCDCEDGGVAKVRAGRFIDCTEVWTTWSIYVLCFCWITWLWQGDNVIATVAHIQIGEVPSCKWDSPSDHTGTPCDITRAERFGERIVTREALGITCMISVFACTGVMWKGK